MIEQNEKNVSVKIAKELGISQATVSRAMRHCGGVDSMTRRQILSCLDPADASSSLGCDVYVILPDTPRYFWKEIKEGMIAEKKNTSVSIKINIYTNVRDEETVLFYLNEAEKLGAKVVLLSAMITPAIAEKLNLLRRHTAIFLVSEGGDVTNSFYFGADAYGDGFRLGKIFCERYSEMTPIVVNVKSNYNVEKRTQGFTDALRQYDGVRFETMPVCFIHHTVAADPKLFPSKLAAVLSEWMEEERSYCLYIPFGNIYQSRVFLKAKRGSKLTCITHDCVIGEDGKPENGIAVTLKQNTFDQGKAAIRAAVRYVTEGVFPGKKYTYVPSEIFDRTEK